MLCFVPCNCDNVKSEYVTYPDALISWLSNLCCKFNFKDDDKFKEKDGYKVYVTLDQSICCIGVLFYSNDLKSDNDLYKLYGRYYFKPKCSLDQIFV